jgi:excinuclease UvrABC nuclease subunit
MSDRYCHGKRIVILHWVGPLLLNRVEIDRVPDGISGVYLLHHFDVVVGGYSIFYVGKAENIKRRLSQHSCLSSAKPRISSARRLSQTYFSAAPVPRTILQKVESSLIDALRPVCNDLIPRSEALIVSLPPLFL